ncbi:unnamed protein product, partial [Ectocarpus sp. 4 AP-2014]
GSARSVFLELIMLDRQGRGTPGLFVVVTTPSARESGHHAEGIGIDGAPSDRVGDSFLGSSGVSQTRTHDGESICSNRQHRAQHLKKDTASPKIYLRRRSRVSAHKCCSVYIQHTPGAKKARKTWRAITQ